MNVKQMTEAQAADVAAFLFGVKRYCTEHYANGWCDIIVETQTDEELADTIKGARTLKGAIRKARESVADYAEQRRAVQNERF